MNLVSFLTLLVLLGYLGAEESAFREPVLPSIPTRTFSIAEFGAKGDDRTDNTRAVQTALDAAGTAGGGKVTVPRGEFLCVTLKHGSHIELHL